MRQWLGIEPKYLCRHHLLGEHNEHHKAVGNLANGSGVWARSLIRSGYLEPRSFQSRHDALAAEMMRRGYKHNSPLPDFDVSEFDGASADRERNIRDLFSRCAECKERFREAK